MDQLSFSLADRSFLVNTNMHLPTTAQGAASGCIRQALPNLALQPAPGQSLAGAASAGRQLRVMWRHPNRQM